VTAIRASIRRSWKRNPTRWTGNTRNEDMISEVPLNPEHKKEEDDEKVALVIKA
jgi:hypothetical protein